MGPHGGVYSYHLNWIKGARRGALGYVHLNHRFPPPLSFLDISSCPQIRTVPAWLLS